MASYTIGDIPERDDVRCAPPPMVPQTESSWTVRIPAIAFLATIKPSHYVMLTVLEWHCRDRSYCWASNAALAKATGNQARQVQVILREMEQAGIIYRLAVNPAKPTDGRAGIFLHKRLDSDRPVEDVPPPPEAVARLWAARDRSAGRPEQESSRAEKCAPPAQKNAHPPCAEKCARNKDDVENKDDDEQRPESSSSFSLVSEEEMAALAAKAAKRFGLEPASVAPLVLKASERYPASWIEAALDVPRLRAWSGVLGTLRNWREDGGMPPRKARPAFDPAAWLGRVAALGIAFGVVDGEVRMSEAVHSPGWSKGGLGSELWGQFQRYKAEIKAHVLAGGATAAVDNRRA